MEDVTEGTGTTRLTAEEIDEARKKSVAYEYLCHLEEAKKWLEAVLKESLPPCTDLEENLRNGVYLAKLGHYIASDTVPLAKIYDLEQKRYKFAGLQFRHTDNINYWLKALVTSGLPKTFHPETTDVYDKKGMPKVIYCIHALSTHLYKHGKAPLIQDLYGKVNFTDAQINNMKQELEINGAAIPLFQHIGGLLNNGDVNIDTLDQEVTFINDAIDKKDIDLLLTALKNPAVGINYLLPDYKQYYYEMLQGAKLLKVEAHLNRSASDSFISDEYSDLLSQIEIQGHVTTVNVACTYNEIIETARKGDEGAFLPLLNKPWLHLKNIYDRNVKFYIEQAAKLQLVNCDRGLIENGINDHMKNLENIICEGNKRGQHEEEIWIAMKKLQQSIELGNREMLWNVLKNPILAFDIQEFALPLYFEELKDDMEENEVLVHHEVKVLLKTLNNIASITKFVDTNNLVQTWECLSDSGAYFSNLDPALKVKYWQSLKKLRQLKLVRESSCSLLTYFDIQNCIDIVNGENEDQNEVIHILHTINTAVSNKDLSALTTLLQNPALKLYNFSSRDGTVYLKMLESLQQNKRDDAELWLNDIQEAHLEVQQEVQEVQRVGVALSQINMALKQEDIEFTMDSLLSAGFNFNNNMKNHEKKYFTIMKQYRERKMLKSQCPWVTYKTTRGNRVFLNMEDFSYSWTKPRNYKNESQYLSLKEVKAICNEINNDLSVKFHEKVIVRLQAYIRGYLVRKKEKEKQQIRSAVKIQSWWRGIRQRQKFKDLLQNYYRCRKSYQFDTLLRAYKKEEEKVIKIQALWRGRQARQAFTSLIHRAQPSFKVVCQFAPLLNINNDDYARELQLQNLKGQVVQSIRLNQQLAQQLDAMDIKIGLLVQNRITLQDVVVHSKHLNDLAQCNATGETSGAKGLKSLNKGSRKRLEGYQHLFYMLQTNPSYLSKLLFCLPKDRTSKFIITVIWALFNFGSNLRENYLLLRLFRSALQEEVRANFSDPTELITSMPLVLQMVVEHARQSIGPNSLQNMLGPLVQKVLDDKSLVITTNPIDIFLAWRNQQETELGRASDLPSSVTPEQALAYDEVQNRLSKNIEALKNCTLVFLNRISKSKDLIPYGLLYMARVLYDTLLEKFPNIPEKDVLKVVGNLIYYHYINPAIIGPDSFGIITLTADCSLSHVQRLNLASIAKILQFASTKRGFGEESKHLMCLNNFIIECHKKLKQFFKECCQVEELEDHFSLHQYSEATLISRPVICISLQEICDTHSLLIEYLEKIAPDPMDPLCELLEDMGPAPTIATLTGTNPNDPSHLQLAKIEVCLILVNKFEVPEDDITDINKLFIKTKETLVCVFPCLKGSNLLEALCAEETEKQQFLYKELVEKRLQKKQLHQRNVLYQSCPIDEISLRKCKIRLQHDLSHLELMGLVSKEDGYQNIITSIAHDICNRGKYREIIRKELITLRNTKECLDQKTKFYEEQVTLYNQYIEKCLENLNAGRRNIHSLKNSTSRRKLKSKLVLKYTATRLHEKGILLEVEGLPPSQFKNVQFEIAPTGDNGIFTICGRFMGVDLEKVDLDIQHLLQLQFEGASVMDIFGKAKVNVNLLLFLLNKKFYGKM